MPKKAVLGSFFVSILSRGERPFWRLYARRPSSRTADAVLPEPRHHRVEIADSEKAG